MFPRILTVVLGGMVFGMATSAGVFALLIKLGVVPRIITKFHLAESVLICELAVMIGTVCGCVSSLFENVWVGKVFMGAVTPGNNVLTVSLLCLLGLCAGVFIGCQAMALAEILNMFPILFRRFKLQMGLGAMLMSVALGKMVGSLWYFIFSYQSM